MLTDSRVVKKTSQPNDTISYNKYYQYVYNDYNTSDNFNAFYELNKNNMIVEKSAIDDRNPNTLYYAAVEQTKVLNSIVVRIRNTSQSIRKETIDDIQYIIPNDLILAKFEEAIAASDVPKERLIRYKVTTITYPNMAIFLGLFKNEIDEFASVNNNTADLEKPFHRQIATKFLLNNTETYAKNDMNILEKEEIDIMTRDELYQLLSFFKRKANIIITLEKDFRTFYMYLREFKLLNDVIKEIRPTIRDDGKIQIGDNTTNVLDSFNDYLTLYKHYSMMIRYMTETVTYYESKFFNKIYSIQSNIQSFRCLIDTIISKYATRMRNVDEAIDAADAAIMNTQANYIMGLDALPSVMNDTTNPIKGAGEDAINGLRIKHIDGMEPEKCEDINDKDIIKSYRFPNVDISKFENIDVVDNTHVVPANMYASAVSDKTVSTALDDVGRRVNSVYESISPRDILNNREEVINEAMDAQDDAKRILEGIRKSVVEANAKFRDSAHEIHEEYGDLHEKGKQLDTQSLDLSGVTFSMYNYPKGVDVMHRIRIPSYRSADAELLMNDAGVGYKEKYFKKLYYFSQREVPINMNKMRGSIAQKSVQEYGANEIFAWAIEYIETYDKVISAISHSNARIIAAIDKAMSLMDSSYGGDDPNMVEAIILNRTMFRNEIMDILFEADMPVQQAVQTQPIEQQPAEQVPQDQQQVPQEQPQDQQLNIDDAAAQDANDSDYIGNSIREYVRIAYEVNSTRMMIYEEALENAFGYLKLVMDSLDRGPVPQEQMQPVDDSQGQQPQEQPVEQVPQEQQQVPQEQQMQQ